MIYILVVIRSGHVCWSSDFYLVLRLLTVNFRSFVILYHYTARHVIEASRQLPVMSKSSNFCKFDWEKSRDYLWILWKRLHYTWPT